MFKFYGFHIEDPLFIGWQYTRDVMDESKESYENSAATFQTAFNMDLMVKKDQKEFDLSEGDERGDGGFPSFLDFISTSL